MEKEKMNNQGKTRSAHGDYEAFVGKFRPKKTTDDCYTPAYVYDAVLGWVREKCRIPESARIVRPFWPGGDYENFPYRLGDVVVDNPPFSIVSKIRRFYSAKGIPFFLFAPHLTLISSYRDEENVTFIVACGDIVYENGASVNTDFITNMWPGDDVLVVAGDLHRLIDEVKGRHKVYSELPRYIYPPNVVSPPVLGKIAERGLTLSFPRKEVRRIGRLDSQVPHKKSIFGGGLLISERLAAERLAAERLAAERLAERTTYCWELSDREKDIVRRLST